MKYVIGGYPGHSHHRKGKKYYVEWDGVTYEIPSNIAVPEYVIQFVEEDWGKESITFLSTKRFFFDLEKMNYPNTPYTSNWYKIKEWADKETEEALSHLIKV